MSDNLAKRDQGDIPLFPVEEEVWDQLHTSGKSQAVDIALSWLGADLEEEARRLLRSRHQDDVNDACQEGWIRFLTKLENGELTWQGHGTIYRELCRCISSGIRKEGRRREIPVARVTGNSLQENDSRKRTRRIKAIPFPTTDNTEDKAYLTDHFFYQNDIFSRLDDQVEVYKKYQFIIEVTSQALAGLASSFDQNMCILWFFMKLSPQDICQAWQCEIHQGRLRRAKIEFVERNLKLLEKERVQYSNRGLLDWLEQQTNCYERRFIEEIEWLYQAEGVSSPATQLKVYDSDMKDEAWVTFINQLSLLFLHFKAGDKSDKDLNQNHVLVGLLHSLVPSGYLHKPRATHAVTTFIQHYKSVNPCDW